MIYLARWFMFLSGLFCSFVSVADSSADNARRLIELTRVERMSAPAYAQVRQMLTERYQEAGGTAEQLAVLERYQAQAQAALDRVVGSKQLVPQLLPLYQDAFTDEELVDLVAFYESPLGRKALEHLPEMTGHAAELIQQQLQRAVPEINQLLQQMQADLAASASVEPE